MGKKLPNVNYDDADGTTAHFAFNLLEEGKGNGKGNGKGKGNVRGKGKEREREREKERKGKERKDACFYTEKVLPLKRGLNGMWFS